MPCVPPPPDSPRHAPPYPAPPGPQVYSRLRFDAAPPFPVPVPVPVPVPDAPPCSTGNREPKTGNPPLRRQRFEGLQGAIPRARPPVPSGRGPPPGPARGVGGPILLGVGRP